MEETEETTDDQSCVKTILGKNRCPLWSTINDLVQATSEVECRASSLYTLALFRCFEDTGTISQAFFTQGFVKSCFVAVSTTNPAPFAPDPICEQYRREAMLHVPPVSFDFRLMGQTINSLARRYLTAIKNSFVQHLRKRQLRAVRFHVHDHHPNLTKSASGFVTNYIIWKIQGEPPESGPDAGRYKDGVKGLGIITDNSELHDAFIQAHRVHGPATDMTVDKYNGYFSDRNIGRDPHHFFGYMVYLYDTIKASYDDDQNTKTPNKRSYHNIL